MGCGLGFILFENICVCFAFIDLCPQEQTTIPNDQSFYRHSGRVWLRVDCKPKCTVAALHRVKKKGLTGGIHRNYSRPSKQIGIGSLPVMVIRIASVVLSFAGLLALILGLLFWTNSALNLIQMHMLLGLLAVGALWVIGIGQAFSRVGSWLLAACALVVGAAMIIIGLNQSALMLGPFHWVVQILHLLLGLLVIGIGHIGAARYRKGTSSTN
jgi:hypothetical protein